MELVRSRHERISQSILNHPRRSSPYKKRSFHGIVRYSSTYSHDCICALIGSAPRYTSCCLALGAFDDWLLVLETRSHILALYDRARLSLFVTVVRRFAVDLERGSPASRG
jgi:hypothetical protein